MSAKGRRRWFARVAPGILVAATGVGAGDLMTASFAGSKLGATIIWAVVVGAGMKWLLTEGLARWQMATGTTLLEGWTRHLRIHWLFVAYLALWSFTVGGALVSACGAAGHALLPLGDITWLRFLHAEPAMCSKISWGVLHSVAGMALVLLGGFRFFERLMSVCIGFMFVGVVYCAVRVLPEVHWGAPPGAALPTHGEQVQWVLGLIGGVGGTVTLLSYGYWIREHNRSGHRGVRLCRFDLGVGYTMTVLFGVGMVVIASTIPGLEGKGAGLAATIADRLEPILGRAGRYVFLLGFWGAVFSSLLGVWQSVPYLFADLVRTRAAVRRGIEGEAGEVDSTRTWPYLGFLGYLAGPPLVLLWYRIAGVQLAYALTGAAFLPLLAVTLLIMNNHPRWSGAGFRNGWLVNLLLVLTLVFFAWNGYVSASDALQRFGGG